MSRLVIVLCCLALIGCEKNPPPAPPVIGAPVENATINGTERIGWDQPAANAVTLAKIGYAIYVDGTRRIALESVSCAPSAATASPAAFTCSARLPALTAGAHTLELVSFVDDGGQVESARSAPLRVTVVPMSTPASQIFRPATSFAARPAVTA